ncbi:MAG: ATP-binding cassette domain-containing protein [Phycisphaeraceae bacterium]|nr:ATP-binding cassette domain-containing protein [Phycisphaeraceae bacterium]
MTRAPAITNERTGASDESDAAVRVINLTHTYPPASGRRARRPSASSTGNSSRPALGGVSLSIHPGEFFGILGPNGGGKTTLFRILSTMLRPTSGEVRIFGFDALTSPALAREHLGVVFQNPSLDLKLSAEENLRHQGHLYGLLGADLTRRIDAALSGVNLHDLKNDRVETFSGGMRRRVELAKALLHHPRLLLLDEPATGLDPNARRDVWSLLDGLRSRGVTVALTTHLMDEAERCDRLAILSRGKLVAIDTPSNLKARIGGDVVLIEPESDQAADALAQAIREKFGPWTEKAAPSVVDGRIRFERSDGAALIASVAAVFAGRIRALTVGRPTLEDVFLHLTGEALGQDNAAAETSNTPISHR